jgi:serine/threonine-protein kinase
VREQSVGARGGHAIAPHPHLVLPYTWAAEDDAVVLLMPLLHGGTLEQAIADHGALHPLLVLELTRQVLSGLAAVHEAGWVHRDLKPSNLLLEATGSSSPHARLTATGMVPGTPGYLAPEVLRGQLASPAQDLWAAGVIALRTVDPSTDPRMLNSADATLARVFSGEVGSLPGARELAELLERLLAQDPDERGTAARLCDLIPRPTLPEAAWVLTAHAEPFEVFDQIEPPLPGSAAATHAEVANDGPDERLAVPRGLHDRLSQRAGTSATTPGLPMPDASSSTPAGSSPARPSATAGPPAPPEPQAPEVGAAFATAPNAAPNAAAVGIASPDTASQDAAFQAPVPQGDGATTRLSQTQRPTLSVHPASPASAESASADSASVSEPSGTPAARRKSRWPVVILLVIAVLALATAVVFAVLATRASSAAASPPATGTAATGNVTTSHQVPTPATTDLEKVIHV